MVEKQEAQGGLEGHRQRVSKAKHAAILEAALQEFLDNGFSRAAMVDVADNAGVSTATLYKHFRSKEELFAAIVDHKLADLGDELDASIFDLKPADAVAAIGRTYLKLQFDGGMNALTRIVIAEAQANPELGRDFVNRTVVPRQRMLTEYLDSLVASGELNIPNTARAAQQLMGMFKEMFVWPALFDPEFRPLPDAEAEIRTAVGRFIDLFRARRADAP